MRMINLLLILFITSNLFSQEITGDLILKKIDDNIKATNRITTSRMVIHSRRGTRTIKAKSWTVGKEKSFSEYLAPAREKGTKMLKLEDNLWTYSPSTDRTIKISGHLLRQSVMGSDLSYEDFMEDQELRKIYKAEIVAEEKLNDRNCWVIHLEGLKEDIAYKTRKVWVDKERFLPLKENRYAKSGKLLKTTIIKEVTKVGNRWIAKHVIFKDELKNGKGTEFIIDEIEFDADIPSYKFTKASLRK